MMRPHNPWLVVLTLAVLGSWSLTLEAQTDYLADVSRFTEEFERIQAALEVSFDQGRYVQQLQDLHFSLKKFQEKFSAAPQRQSLSYFLVFTIEDNYLGIIRSLQGPEGRLAETIKQVSAENGRNIRALKVATSAESKGDTGQGWLSAIDAFLTEGDYESAMRFAELGISKAPDSDAVAAIFNRLSQQLTAFRQQLKEAKSLVEAHRYTDALSRLEDAEKFNPKDPDVAELKKTARAAIEKIATLKAEAAQLEAGENFLDAFRRWQELLTLAPDDEEVQKKWEEYKSRLQLVTTEVVRTCTTCSGYGYCPTCKNSSVCAECEGNRRCVLCNGIGYFAQNCPYCVCQTCGGSGTCPTCKGNGTIYCPRCGGRGTFPEVMTIPCSVCGGTGQSPVSRRACSRCGGTGKATVSVDKLCPDCGGRKLVTCPTCNGQRVCAACGGVGRSAQCQVCRGIGRIITLCDRCKGRGFCSTCGGRGFCPVCKGTGKCPECSGATVTVARADEEKFKIDQEGFIAVRTTPEGADVFLNDEKIGQSPITKQSPEPRTYTVRTEKEGFAPFRRTIEFKEGSSYDFDLGLLNKTTFPLRVLTVQRSAHTLRFRNYSLNDDGTFLVSVAVDGNTSWRRTGTYVLGYKLEALEKKIEQEFNPRLGARREVDRSALVLTNGRGKSIRLMKNLPERVDFFQAKVYDDESRRIVRVAEGSQVRGLTVKAITDGEVVLTDGTQDFTLKK